MIAVNMVKTSEFKETISELSVLHTLLHDSLQNVTTQMDDTIERCEQSEIDVFRLKSQLFGKDVGFHGTCPKKEARKMRKTARKMHEKAQDPRTETMELAGLVGGHEPEKSVKQLLMFLFQESPESH